MFWRKKKKNKFFFKANDDVLSFCTCVGAPAMSSGQLDCPWCGCGWMISCSKCTKSFIFAEVRETEVSMVELGRREVEARGLTSVSNQEIAEWAAAMEETLSSFEVGDIVVYLDGSYWTVDAKDIAFEGYFANHKLDQLPHVQALSDPQYLRSVLGVQAYWRERELPDRE